VETKNAWELCSKRTDEQDDHDDRKPRKKREALKEESEGNIRETMCDNRRSTDDREERSGVDSPEYVRDGRRCASSERRRRV